MSRYYPYIWYLDHIKEYKINLKDYHPYQELYLENNNAYINISKLGFNLEEEYNKTLIYSYIRIISKIQNSFLTNPLNIFTKNKKYVIEKYKYKSKYTNDSIYILKSAINTAFKSNIIYLDRDKNQFLIFLDYNQTKENKEIIEEILENFLPINFEAKYTFEHMYKLDDRSFKNLGRWLLL